jgi:hypothetical protein
MYAIKRAINGISINGDEWLLNTDGSTMLFESRHDARCYLLQVDINPATVEIVSCLPDGVTKEIKQYPAIVK